MTFYDEAAEIADELLAEYGQACSLSAVAAGAYNAATGAVALTPTAHPITAAIFDFTLTHIDGTLILVGDKKVLVSTVGLTVSPAPGFSLTNAAGVVYKVVSVKEVAPAGTVAMWILQVRK